MLGFFPASGLRLLSRVVSMISIRKKSLVERLSICPRIALYLGGGVHVDFLTGGTAVRLLRETNVRLKVPKARKAVWVFPMFGSSPRLEIRGPMKTVLRCVSCSPCQHPMRPFTNQRRVDRLR